MPTHERRNSENDSNSASDTCKDCAWKCVRCDGLIGYVSMPRLDVVRIKHKDFYVYIGEPMWVRTICRKCAAINDISDENKVRKASSGTAEESAPDKSA